MRKQYVRCKRCDARRVLPKSLAHYSRIPPCRQCGNNDYRIMQKPKQTTCNCDGYWFPHRDGSLYCLDNPNRPLDMGDEKGDEKGDDLQWTGFVP